MSIADSGTHHPSVRRALFLLVLVCGVPLLQPYRASAQSPFATSGNDVYNTNTGNVGIGTSTPGYKLTVDGPTGINGYYVTWGGEAGVYFDDRTSTGFGVLYRDGGVNALFDSTAGNVISYNASGHVGIGTTAPDRPLVVDGAVVADLDSKAQIEIQSTAAYNASPTAGMAFALQYDSAGYIAYGTSIQGYKENATDGNFAQALRFTTQANGDSPRTRMTIGATGNVGIGTTTPSSALDVAGDVTVSGNISAKYQDLAEWVPAERAMSAGTVVILDSKKFNSVIPSTKAYDPHVAGVVSDSPGIVLGIAAEDKVKVATTGRVRVRVDATQGSIDVGDLLVTSDKEGVARKSAPLNLGGVEIHRPGTLIGKALESLKDGEGEILVLLSLQ